MAHDHKLLTEKMNSDGKMAKISKPNYDETSDI